MKSVYTLPVSLVVVFSLVACGRSSENSKPAAVPAPHQTVTEDQSAPAMIFEESEYQSDVDGFEAAEKALLDIGLKFKKVDPSEETEISEETSEWRWDDEVFNEFSAQNPNVKRADSLTALKHYAEVADAFAEKYSKPFGLKTASGAVERKQLSEGLIAEIDQKIALARDTISDIEQTLEGAAVQAEPEAAEPEAELESEPEAPAPVVVKPPQKAVPSPSKPVSPPVAVKPLPVPQKPVKPAHQPAKPKKQQPPAVVAVKPPQKSKPKEVKAEPVSCVKFMEPIAARTKPFTCRVIGQYSGLDVNTTAATQFSVAQGEMWRHRGEKGTIKTYKVRMGPYEVPLFSLEVAPLQAQPSRKDQLKLTDSCSTGNLKVVNQLKPRGEGWRSPETTEIKSTRSGEMTVTIVKANMNLKLSCR